MNKRRQEVSMEYLKKEIRTFPVSFTHLRAHETA